MEHDLVRFLHSRFGALLMIAVAVVAIVVSFISGGIEHLPGDTGMWLPSANDWLSPGVGSLLVSLSMNVLVAFMLVLLNKWFNILRSVSDLFAGIFLVMQMSLPGLAGQFYGGTLLCFVVVFAVMVLFCAYNRPYPRQPIYMIFLLLAVGSMTQYAYAFYILVFLIGCAQMRIFSVKTLIAALLGIITPVWIMFGFGFVSFEDADVPHFVNIFTALDSDEALQMLVSVGFTTSLMIVFCALTLLRVYNYNSKMRAYNGFMVVLALATAVLVLLDYTNLAIYIPLLNCCAAFQVGHFFVVYQARRSYIAILGIVAVYIGLYAWSFV